MPKTLRDLRIEKGAYQRDVAKACGVKVAAVSRWESGLGEPVPPMVPKLAKYFGITTEAVRLAIEESKQEREMAGAGKE